MRAPSTEVASKRGPREFGQQDWRAPARPARDRTRPHPGSRGSPDACRQALRASSAVNGRGPAGLRALLRDRTAHRRRPDARLARSGPRDPGSRARHRARERLPPTRPDAPRQPVPPQRPLPHRPRGDGAPRRRVRGPSAVRWGVGMGVRLTSTRLSLAAAEAILASRPGGAVVLFAGRVRPDRRGGSTVVALDYEVDRVPALAQLRELERRTRRRFRASGLVLWHRVGRVAVGEVAVVVGAACSHRAAAFRAARYLIEELKRTVPIWKEERGRPARRPRSRRARQAGRSAG
jgi:molybdopterin synthase catalytic subunit